MKYRILFVDDEKALRNLYEKVLKQADYEVTTASNGKDGLNQLKNSAFDLVITDILMPDKDGIELINEIRKQYPNIPIIAVSGGGRMGSEIYLGLAQKLGAIEMLHKPFTKKQLLASVKRILQ